MDQEPVVLCNGTSEKQISSQYIFFCSASSASSETMIEISKFLIVHIQLENSQLPQCEKETTKDKPVV